MNWAKKTARWDEKHVSFLFGVAYIRYLTVTEIQMMIQMTHIGLTSPISVLVPVFWKINESGRNWLTGSIKTLLTLYMQEFFRKHFLSFLGIKTAYPVALGPHGWKGPFILYCQHNGCCWSDDARSNHASVAMLLTCLSTKTLQILHNKLGLLLTHWGWDKMDAISQMTFKYIFLNENVII